MGQVDGFLKIERKNSPYRPVLDRLADFDELHADLDDNERKEQGARCMDCGVPFCQSSYGCPIHNLIPEWNDLVYRGKWKEAAERLAETNPFPEFTGRVCPAPCETACVLGITSPAVTIKDNERAIADRGLEEGWALPEAPETRSGRTVAVVGSGPAGLSAAVRLNEMGHAVTVYEAADRPGGLLTYGIPNMKLDKGLVEKRVRLMEKAGVKFRCNSKVGTGPDCSVDPLDLEKNFDAVLLTVGAMVPRDLPIEGRELQGIDFAVPYLAATTQSVLAGGSGESMEGLDVVVIGGGDTGNDCIGSSVRQGARSVTNLELLPEPPTERGMAFPWPTFPRLLKTDYGHAEAAARFGKDPRRFGCRSLEFVPGDGAEKGKIKGIRLMDVAWEVENGRPKSFTDVEGSETVIPADRVFIAAGFLGPEGDLAEAYGLERDKRSNFAAETGSYATSRDGVFAAGDCRRGQSLVVWAINEGLGAADAVDRYLNE
jgi:glutamate synthase (NADPH/NADH) small chain